MATYRIYLEADLNRVFTKAVGAIAASELDTMLSHRLGAPATPIELVDEGRASFLRFAHDGDAAPLVEVVEMLSATAACFVEHDPTSLEPVAVGDRLAFGTDVVTAQRYKGKTNERLTRLMLNLALATDASKAPNSRSLIDPMCGRGTTLNWALLYGIPAVGLDVDRGSLDEYATFLEKWAQTNRLPHTMQRYKKQHSEGRHFDFTVAADRTALSAKSTPDIRTIHAPADSASAPVKRASMIVSDLPYGIQHQARTGSKNEPTSVGELVENVSALWPAWIRTGGSVVLSWNVKSLNHADMTSTLARAGFGPVESGGFEHHVDRTITRDVVVARRMPA